MLREVLAICLIRRIGDKVDSNIPVEQAAYRAGRGTTEHTFAYKILAEEAITSKNYHLYIALMDMSKAFDTVRRHTLIEDLALIPGGTTPYQAPGRRCQTESQSRKRNIRAIQDENGCPTRRLPEPYTVHPVPGESATRPAAKRR